MLRMLLSVGVVIGSVSLIGCDEEARVEPILLVEDTPLVGEWYLQATGEHQPVAIETTIRFDFREDGTATYEHSHGGPEEPDRHQLTYNLAGDILSIDSDSENPGVPRITGRVVFEEDGQTLAIQTHTDERWLMTRKAKPGGDIEHARHVDQLQPKADPRLAAVQRLAYACSRFASQQGQAPERAYDLVEAGLIGPGDLLASGDAAELPDRYADMAADERSQWFEANSGYAFFFQNVGSGGASSLVVTSIPASPRAKVVIGMANGAVYLKKAQNVAQLLQFQFGALPRAWPAAENGPETVSGLQPLSD